MAFTTKIVRSSFKVAAQYPWDIVRFMMRWSGHKVLTEDDYTTIASHMPYLINVALTCGGIHRSFIISLMGNFIDSLHIKGLSSQARQMLYLAELEKPDEDRDISQFPTWILTNPGFLELEKFKESEKLKEHLENEKKRLDIAEKKALQDEVDDACALGIFNFAYDEFTKNVFDPRKSKWDKKKYPFKAAEYKAAWKKYIGSISTTKLTAPTTIPLLCEALRPVFLNLFQAIDGQVADTINE